MTNKTLSGITSSLNFASCNSCHGPMYLPGQQVGGASGRKYEIRKTSRVRHVKTVMDKRREVCQWRGEENGRNRDR